MLDQNLIPLSNELAQSKRNNRISSLLTHTVIFSAAFLPQNLQAQEKATQLPTVSVINSRAETNYNSTESSNYKITQPLVDTPRTVTTVTRQLMDDQGVTKLSDALRNVPGISLAAGEGGNQGDNLTIRGFSGRSDFFIDGMRDFGSYFRDAFNLESVEVIQGPSSVLFGRGSAGGVISQNSKQAFLGSKTSGSLMAGSNDLARTTVDVNQKISGLEGAAIRLNAMAHTNKVAERDQASFSRNAFAPTVAFGLGTDTRLNLSYFHQEENNTPDYGIPFYSGKPADTHRSNFYGFKNDYFKATANISTIKFEHDFSKDLTLRNQTRYARYDRDTQITNPSTANGSTVTRQMIIRKSLDTYLGNQTDLISKFSTFEIGHNLVTGVAVERETASPTTFTASPTAASTTLQNPIYVNFASSVAPTTVASGKVETLGIYALDTIKINKSWEVSLGARYDNLRTNYNSIATGTSTALSQTDNVVSYNGGIVYKPAKNGSIYLSHGTSFSPSSEQISLSTTSVNLDPEKNISYEFGTKWDLFKKRLTANAAIFRNQKENVRETVNGVGVLSGDQKVDGLMLQLSGKITEKWNVMIGYTYMDGRVTNSLASDNQKNRNLTNTPEHMFNLFTTYKFDSELEIGAGGNFVSERFVSPVNSTSTPDPITGGVRNIPSYITLNAMAKYPVSKNVDLQLNVNNLTNKYYFDQLRGSNAAVPGEGRVFLLSTNVKF